MKEKISVHVPHKLSREQVHDRIDQGFGAVQQKIGGNSVDMSQRWEDDIMHFSAAVMGQSINGRLEVQDNQVLIEVDLPWIMAKLSNSISDKLKKGTQLLLEKK